MKSYLKKDFPVSNTRRFLEPGPVVLVSSARKNETNIMTMGWHMIMEFQPSLIGCYWDANHSFDLIRKSKECVVNIPTSALAKQVVSIGNYSGREVNKFEKFKLTPLQGEKIKAPLIKECYARMQVFLGQLSKYIFFI